MSTIDISIWGIRDGFQQGGFFHSHNFNAVKEIQQDRFRSVKNVIGREGFFMTHRKGGKFIVTFCDTSIKEYNPNAKRGAYVCFSLIIDENFAFSVSPRSVLMELARFYVQRVGESNTNNFEAEDIQIYLKHIQIEAKHSVSVALPGSHYLYYNTPNQIDEILTGKLPFVNLNELVLIPNNEIDVKTNSFKDIAFYDDSYGVTPSYFNLNSFKVKYEDDEIKRQHKAKQAIIDKENERIRQEEEIRQIRQLDSQLAILLNQNKLDEAIKLYKEAPAAAQVKISNQVSNDLKHRIQKKEIDAVDEQRKQEDREKITEIEEALKNEDLEAAAAIFFKLHDKNNKELDPEKREQIQEFNTEKREEILRRQKEEDDKKKKEAVRKKRRKTILFSSVVTISVLFIVSFFTAFPSALWDSDEDGYHTFLDDNCPDEKGMIGGCPDKDNDGILDKLDECPDQKGTVNGCPDSDGDGVADKFDKCDTIPGSTDNHGCPEPEKMDSATTEQQIPDTYDLAPQEESDKLLKGIPVKTPSDGLFYRQNVGQKWIKFKSKNYEFSKSEKNGYQPVKTQETVDLLNKYYGLKGELKQVGSTTAPITQTPKTSQTTKPRNQNQTQTNTTTKNKLTDAEENELKELLKKFETTPLNLHEIKRKNELMKKRDGKL